MDAKITKERLGRMLSYDWLKIVGICIAVIFVWVLVFTTSATRITTAQQFTVVNYFGNAATTNTSFSKDFASAYQNGLFSYEVLDITEVDVGGNKEVGGTLWQTRLATEEGDVVFVPNIINPDSEFEVNGQKYQETYLQNLARGQRFLLADLDRNKTGSYFKKLESFLNMYYQGDYLAGSLNEELVKRDFLARIEKNKDKRFKKPEQIEKGIQDEIARVKKYRDALIEFDKHVADGFVEFTTTKVLDNETGEVLYEGVFGINICPDPAKMPNLTKLTGYWEEVKNEAGETQAPKLSAKDMHIALLVFDSIEDSFEFEDLLYINHVIRSGKAQ